VSISEPVCTKGKRLRRRFKGKLQDLTPDTWISRPVLANCAQTASGLTGTQGDTTLKTKHLWLSAPVAQRIERWSPEPTALSPLFRSSPLFYNLVRASPT
jgi:hypothetical protein